MNRLHAYEHHGPCIDPRTVTLRENIDPLGTGDQEEWSAERQIFNAMEFQAQALVLSGDEILKEGAELHDYRGFGSCIAEAIGAAAALYDKLGDRVSTIVRVRLVAKPALFAPDEAFYHGAVKVFYALPRWGVSWKGGEYQELVNLDEKAQEFTIWQNGNHTDEWAKVQRLIAELPAQDIATDRRRNRRA